MKFDRFMPMRNTAGSKDVVTASRRVRRTVLFPAVFRTVTSLGVVVLLLTTSSSMANPRDKVLLVEGAEIKTKIVIPAQRLRRRDGCDVQVNVTYGQRHTVARVRTTVSETQCVPSEGAYTLRIRTVDDNGDPQTRDHRETWRRDDNEPIEHAADYDLQGDPRLLWVRVRKSAKDDCTCLDVAEDVEGP